MLEQPCAQRADVDEGAARQLEVFGDAPAEEQLTLTGLQCALVADADAVLIDDCRLPLVVAAESDSHQERLLYEQAFELARPLGEAVDFTFEDGGIALTPSGSGRLARLTEALGGIWSGQGRREELIVLALTAIHAMQRGPDYDVANGRLDEMLYERGRLYQGLPFPELRQRSFINAKAQALPEQADFSAGIRAGLPGFDEQPVQETTREIAP